MDHPIFDRVTSPMQTGEAYRAMQHLCNVSGFTDDAGRALDEDGKYGNKSLQAYKKFMTYYASAPETKELKIYIGKELIKEFKIMDD